MKPFQYKMYDSLTKTLGGARKRPADSTQNTRPVIRQNVCSGGQCELFHQVG